MKKILAALILILTLQTPSWANDIRDFQIEGISIGDSLLDYFSREEINNNNIDKSEINRKFHRIQFVSLSSFENYDGIHIYIKPKEKDFIIYGISGMIEFVNDINNCQQKRKEITKEIYDLFTNPEILKDVINHRYDKSGKSKLYRTNFKISPKSQFYEGEISCFDWSEKMKFKDHLRISIKTDEVNKFYEDLYK